MSKSVFLCYRLTDSEIVERTRSDLARHGFDAWSYDDVMPGQSWRSVMNQALVEAETVVIFLSPSFIENELCRQQVYIAQSLKKRIIPTFIHYCLDLLDSTDEFSQLKGLHIIPFVAEDNKARALADDYEAIFPQLLAAIRPHEEPIPLNAQHNYVSFSRLDYEFVVKLCADVNKSGLHAWSTATSLCGGDDWRNDIAQAVLTARCFILVLSLEAVQSYWVRREVLLAQLKGIPIIPVISPRALQGSSYEQEYPRLRDAVAAIYEMNPINDINWIYPKANYDQNSGRSHHRAPGLQPDQRPSAGHLHLLSSCRQPRCHRPGLRLPVR